MFDLNNLDTCTLIIISVLIIAIISNNSSSINNDGVINSTTSSNQNLSDAVANTNAAANVAANVAANAVANAATNTNAAVALANTNATAVAADAIPLNGIQGYSGNEFATTNIKQTNGLNGWSVINNKEKGKIIKASDLKPQTDSSKNWWDNTDLLKDSGPSSRGPIPRRNDALRNANRSIRPDPPIKQLVVSPWNNTTINPNQFVKSLC